MSASDFTTSEYFSTMEQAYRMEQMISETVKYWTLNIDAKNEQEVNIDVGDLSAKSVTGRILRSNKLQDHNSVDNLQKIKLTTFDTATLNENNLSANYLSFLL